MKLASAFILIFLFASNFLTASSSCSNRHYIRTQDGYALEASSNAVVTSFFNSGTNSQSWVIGCVDKPGTFSIRNVQTWTVLDIGMSDRIVLSPQNIFSDSQLWYINNDGHIINFGTKKALQVSTIGEFVTLETYSSKPTQLLILQERI